MQHWQWAVLCHKPRWEFRLLCAGLLGLAQSAAGTSSTYPLPTTPTSRAASSWNPELLSVISLNSCAFFPTSLGPLALVSYNDSAFFLQQVNIAAVYVNSRKRQTFYSLWAGCVSRGRRTIHGQTASFVHGPLFPGSVHSSVGVVTICSRHHFVCITWLRCGCTKIYWIHVGL